MSLLRHTPLLLVLLASIAALLVPGTARAAVLRPRHFQPQASTQAVPPHSLYLPSNAAARQPLPVLVAVHGMGGDGASFAAPLLAQAERNGWVVVAPTFAYGDWRDPEQVRRDDTTFLPRLKVLLDSLSARTGLQLQPGALLYGFSRGGQIAHRFASFYPGSVAGVASFSGGTFTLPYRTLPEHSNQPLTFPFGLGDIERYTGNPPDLERLRQVEFLIGVGASDNRAGDVPRQWDPYVGSTRLERAQRYTRALESLGVRAQLRVFPNLAHGETAESRASALDFLASVR